MISKITDKFQITIPKAVRTKLKLYRNDSIEWDIREEGITVQPVKKTFLKYKGIIKAGKGNIEEDIEKSKKIRAKKNK